MGALVLQLCSAGVMSVECFSTSYVPSHVYCLFHHLLFAANILISDDSRPSLQHLPLISYIHPDVTGSQHPVSQTRLFYFHLPYVSYLDLLIP